MINKGLFEGSSLPRDRLLQLMTDSNQWDCLLEALPEVARLRGVPQRADFHGEGDVFNHTRLALTALSERVDNRAVWGVLLHDVGKASTTKLYDGVWRSLNHSKVGAELVPGILERFGLSTIAADVSWLVRHHHFFLEWQNFEKGLTRRQLRFCENPLFPLLVQVCQADAKASLGSSKGKVLESLLRIIRQTD